MVDAGTHCWRTDGERERPGIGKITILRNFVQYTREREKPVVSGSSAEDKKV